MPPVVGTISFIRDPLSGTPDVFQANSVDVITAAHLIFDVRFLVPAAPGNVTVVKFESTIRDNHTEVVDHINKVKEIDYDGVTLTITLADDTGDGVTFTYTAGVPSSDRQMRLLMSGDGLLYYLGCHCDN